MSYLPSNRAEREGYSAHRRGEEIDANPYIVGTFVHESWLLGYRRAVAYTFRMTQSFKEAL